VLCVFLPSLLGVFPIPFLYPVLFAFLFGAVYQVYMLAVSFGFFLVLPHHSLSVFPVLFSVFVVVQCVSLSPLLSRFFPSWDPPHTLPDLDLYQGVVLSKALLVFLFFAIPLCMFARSLDGL
jgi:hypothetical protein